MHDGRLAHAFDVEQHRQNLCARDAVDRRMVHSPDKSDRVLRSAGNRLQALDEENLPERELPVQRPAELEGH